MAVVIGTNAGFVTAAPTLDPNGATSGNFSNQARAISDTSSATAGKVVEIGWYSSSATAEANFEVGLYADTGTTAGALLGVSRINAKGTGAGWKKATVDISISPLTKYYMAFQIDSPGSPCDYGNDARGYVLKDGVTTLPDPFAGSWQPNYIFAIYAVWEEAPVGTNMKINISDVFKDIESLKINIGNVWKDVIKVQQNIGDVWKTVFG